MRWTAGTLLILHLASLAFAQADGKVVSIGFDGRYRPNCWVPMRVEVAAGSGDSQSLRLGIRQDDLDKDKVLFTRPVTLTGNAPGATPGRGQEVWAYFKPQPNDLVSNLPRGELANIIQVYLYNSDGLQLKRLPLDPRINLISLDDPNAARVSKLILVVDTGTTMSPVWPYDKARGVSENMEHVRLSPRDLPTHSIGYDMADAIVILAEDPAKISDDAMSAIEQWVKLGGRLVVIQGNEFQRLRQSALAPLLPVNLEGVGSEKGLKSLNRLAEFPDFARWAATKSATQPADRFNIPDVWLTTDRNRQKVPIDPWEKLRDKDFALVQGTLRSGAINALGWYDEPTRPYLARWRYGQGMVTWVAQNVFDAQLRPPRQRTDDPRVQRPDLDRIGWPAVWDRLLDYPNNTRIPEMTPFVGKTDYETTYDNSGNTVVELGGGALQKGMDHSGRGAGYVAIAMLFFIGYWAIAGPGTYFFLLAKKRADLSWPAFAVCAIIGTGLTVVIVKLVLRGPPEVRHITFVRVAPDGQAIAWSNFGLYIPRDGMQDIELRETDGSGTSFITPYPVHPTHRDAGAEIPAYQEYQIPLRDRSSADSTVAIQAPFRSTLKKFQARWVGKTEKTVVGQAVLHTNRQLAGKLTNNTGADLSEVYFIYRETARAPYSDQGGDAQEEKYTDSCWYIPDSGSTPAWKAGITLDLAAVRQQLKTIDPDHPDDRSPGQIGFRGHLNDQWLVGRWRNELVDRAGSYAGDRPNQPPLLLSIYDRLRPLEKRSDAFVRSGRAEIRRDGARHLDASPVISGGSLLVLARGPVDAPIPIPLRVAEIKQMQGSGTVYYQFIIPLERTPEVPGDLPVESGAK